MPKNVKILKTIYIKFTYYKTDNQLFCKKVITLI